MGWPAGVPRSEETRAKISAGNLGKIVSIKTRKKISLANRGKIQTIKTRKKIRDAHNLKPKARYRPAKGTRKNAKGYVAIAIRLHPDMMKTIEKMAKSSDVSFSEQVRRMLDFCL